MSKEGNIVHLSHEKRIEELKNNLRTYSKMAEVQDTKIRVLESRISAHGELLRILSNALLALKHRVEDIEHNIEYEKTLARRR